MHPEERLRGADPMVPLTQAWLEYRWGERHRREAWDTLIVNCRSATRIEMVHETEVMATRPRPRVL